MITINVHSTAKFTAFHFCLQYGLYEEAQAGTLVLVNEPDDDISNGEKKNSSDQSEDLTEEKKILPDGGDEKEETITQQDETTHKQNDVTEEVKVPTDSPVDTREPHTDTKTRNESNVEGEEEQTPKINSSQSEENTERPSPLEKLDEIPDEKPDKKQDEKPTSVINLDEIDIGEMNKSLKEVSEIGHLYYVIEDSSQESPPDSLKHEESDVILHNDEIDVVIENESNSNTLPPNGTVNCDRTSQ